MPNCMFCAHPAAAGTPLLAHQHSPQWVSAPHQAMDQSLALPAVTIQTACLGRSKTAARVRLAAAGLYGRARWCLLAPSMAFATPGFLRAIFVTFSGEAPGGYLSNDITSAMATTDFRCPWLAAGWQWDPPHSPSISNLTTASPLPRASWLKNRHSTRANSDTSPSDSKAPGNERTEGLRGL